LGQEDGQVHAYELNKDRKSYKKEVFSIQQEKGVAEFQDDFQNTRFSDSKHVHSNSVSALEKNPQEYGVFLSAALDGSLAIWKFLPDNGAAELSSGLVKKPTISQNEVFSQVVKVDIGALLKEVGKSESTKAQPVLCAKWLDGCTILVSTQAGQLLALKWDKQEKVEAEVVLKSSFNPIWSIALLNSTQVALACDSGEVVAYDWQEGKLQNKKMLTKGVRESALKMTFKNGLLAVGFQSYWEVLRESG